MRTALVHLCLLIAALSAQQMLVLTLTAFPQQTTHPPITQGVML